MSSTRPTFGTLVAETGRLLTFRPAGPPLREHPDAFLAFGLVVTLVAGIGRYWDHPNARLWQTLGLGSVVYVFILAGVLRLFLAPLGRSPLSYRTVLTFVTLTSPPALLYAIPVERFMPLPAAQTANVAFLAVVALWRVVLLYAFARRVGGLGVFETLVGTLLPLAVIVFSLAVLNLEHVAFSLMAGIMGSSPNDVAYLFVVQLAALSMVAAPVLLLLWLGLAAWARKQRKLALREEVR